MNILGEAIPRWPLVSLVSRAARHVQGAFLNSDVDKKIAINNAIKIAEDSAVARSTRSSDAMAAADAARNVGRAAMHKVLQLAAQCASNAALATTLEGPALIALATETIQFALDCNDRYRQYLAFDLESCVKLADGLKDADPVPAGMLDFIHRQAIHEAGHVVAATILGLPVIWVQMVYGPSVDAGNPFRNGRPNQLKSNLSQEKRRAYRLVFAAGAAADEMFGADRAWAAMDDRECHRSFGNCDFNADVAVVRQLKGFGMPVIADLADLFNECAAGNQGSGKFQDLWYIHNSELAPILARHGINEYLI